jgi:hypothetical protein
MWRPIILCALLASSLAVEVNPDIDGLVLKYGREFIQRFAEKSVERLAEEGIFDLIETESLEASPWTYLNNLKDLIEGFIRGMQKNAEADGACLTAAADIETDFEDAAAEATRCIFFNLTACVELANFGNILIETIQQIEIGCKFNEFKDTLETLEDWPGW